MDRYFKDNPNIIIYIDDILLFTKTKEGHYKLLQQFIEIIQNARINLSENKTKVFTKQIEIIGKPIDKGGAKMQLHIITKVLQYPLIIDTTKIL